MRSFGAVDWLVDNPKAPNNHKSTAYSVILMVNPLVKERMVDGGAIDKQQDDALFVCMHASHPCAVIPFPSQCSLLIPTAHPLCEKAAAVVCKPLLNT